MKQEEEKREREAVWRHTVIQVAALVVAALVFLFGDDVIGRLGGNGMAGKLDGDSVTTETTDDRRAPLHATYSFKMAPFVHPKIINDLVGSMSDSGDQVVAINLLDSHDSNRYFGEIAVTPQLEPTQLSWPWVYSVDGEVTTDKTLGELWGRSWFAYRYLGSTPDGLDVVHTRHSGGDRESSTRWCSPEPRWTVAWTIRASERWRAGRQRPDRKCAIGS